MSVYKFDPTTDSRWATFLEQHSDASVFHTKEWLRTLQQTYGYKPVAYSTSNGNELTNAVVFCQIESRLTGKRLVSLPFSDHCQPLASGKDLREILNYLQDNCNTERFKYVELRPIVLDTCMDERKQPFVLSERFSLQRVDLRPELNALYKNFHDSCIRRKVKRADREGLLYDMGRSEELQKKFRHLLLLTRRRHKLPPQPSSWLRNIVNSLGEMVTIHVLSKSDMPVASIVTLKYKSFLVYKYGCSDTQFNNIGATPLLFWKLIQQAKAENAQTLDLGRSSCDDLGLIAFKEHLGAVSSELSYYRNRISTKQKLLPNIGVSVLARQALVHLPDPLFSKVGQLLYRHIG
jgi:lipid II:glycine glycyltransferase (peptidoglycan interpeptide bridge formation enzyme)